MTVQEAIERIKWRKWTASNMVGMGADGKAFEDLEMAIEALEKQEQIKKENNQLKNRCRVLTGGMLCFTCPFECHIRNDEFRGEINERT